MRIIWTVIAATFMLSIPLQLMATEGNRYIAGKYSTAKIGHGSRITARGTGVVLGYQFNNNLLTEFEFIASEFEFIAGRYDYKYSKVDYETLALYFGGHCGDNAYLKWKIGGLSREIVEPSWYRERSDGLELSYGMGAGYQVKYLFAEIEYTNQGKDFNALSATIGIRY